MMGLAVLLMFSETSRNITPSHSYYVLTVHGLKTAERLSSCDEPFSSLIMPNAKICSRLTSFVVAHIRAFSTWFLAYYLRSNDSRYRNGSDLRSCLVRSWRRFHPYKFRAAMGSLGRFQSSCCQPWSTIAGAILD